MHPVTVSLAVVLLLLLGCNLEVPGASSAGVANSASEPDSARGQGSRNVKSVDGDDLVLDGERIRLFGVDALEYHQTCKDDRGRDWPCGHRAAESLAALIQGKSVHCEPQDRDAYNRTVARCYAGDLDIGRAQVQNGWARAYRRYSTDYVGDEEAARDAGRGMWSSTTQNPETWRRENPRD